MVGEMCAGGRRWGMMVVLDKGEKNSSMKERRVFIQNFGADTGG